MFGGKKQDFRHLLVVLCLAVSSFAQAENFVVNSSGDENNPVDDQLTLREAIAAANANAEADTITLPAGISIQTAMGFTITGEVSIEGVLGSEAEINSSASQAVFSVGSGVTANFESLKLSGAAAGISGNDGVRACGTVTVSKVVMRNFTYAFALCFEDSNLAVSASFIEDNVQALAGHVYAGTSSDILFDKSVLVNSGVLFRAYGADASLEIRNSLYSMEDRYLWLEGNPSLRLVGSSFVSANQFMLSAKYDSRTDILGEDPITTYYYPDVEIIQSTIATNTAAESVMKFDGADVVIGHSTIAENTSVQNLLVFRGKQDPNTDVWMGSVKMDHSIMSENSSGAAAITLRRIDLVGSYSFLPQISKETGTEAFTFDATTSLYQGAPAGLGDLIVTTYSLPHYLPQADSLVIDAGDAAAVAGVGGVPLLEQRQSQRIVGVAIDIGATEYNREPLLDKIALVEAYDQQVAALGDPNDDVVLDLDNFVSDPDGHAIASIDFTTVSDVDFDAGTHIISGNKAAFLTAPMVVEMEDETGLVGGSEVDWSPAPFTSKESDKSSDFIGAIPIFLMSSFFLLYWRRKQ